MIQKPKGTIDIFGKEAENFLYFRKLLTELMDKYNYKYFQTPIFEFSELFHRGVGETTDIVSKETYDFKDRGDRNMTLRPEGTAGIVRSFIENKIYAETMPFKTWYFGPMFRYERPQSGRQREFTQFGVEAFGSNDPMLDAEIISIVVNLFQLLGLKNVKVNLNSLGDQESRIKYRKALLEYFKPYIDNLCEDCQGRYAKNPLRILDCKIDMENPIIKKAPTTIQYLNEESKAHYIKVKQYLDNMDINYIENDKLVRGLDYYTHTIFEIAADIKGFGAQNILCGGGRYNSLVETMGGPNTPGVGFAIGVERILLALKTENIDISEENNIDIYIFALEEKQKPNVISLVNHLRLNGFNVDADYMNRNIKNNFKYADKINARYIIIIGEEEVNSKLLTIKDNKTKQEYKVKSNDIVQFFDEKLKVS